SVYVYSKTRRLDPGPYGPRRDRRGRVDVRTAPDEGAVVGAQQVTDRFTELYGTAPQGVWAAPGRVNLIGEHTDYNDGFVMPFALPHRTTAAVSPRTDGILRLHSADADAPVAELTV